MLRQRGRTQVALPALLPVMRRSPLTMVRHVPLVLFLAGIPFFAVALADPLTGFAREEVSYPGRRIALLVDGSTSMVIRFESDGEASGRGDVLHRRRRRRAVHPPPHERSVSRSRGADSVRQLRLRRHAVHQRLREHPVEPGSSAIRASGDGFRDWGTTIIEGIDQATQLFKTFDFVNASGNLMIVITDGRDSQLNQQSGALERMVAETRAWRIPVYMLRTAYNRREGEVLQDKIWRATVERTGGRFYAIYDDESTNRALREIDRLSPGRIETREYSVARPRYAGYALIAVGLWLTAALLKLNFGVFRTFP